MTDLHPTGCSCCQSFNNGTIWICGATERATPWKLSRRKWPKEIGKGHKVYVPCCNRNAPLEDTQTRWEEAYGGYACDHYFRCAPKAGCNANPGYKRTAHLRYFE